MTGVALLNVAIEERPSYSMRTGDLLVGVFGLADMDVYVIHVMH